MSANVEGGKESLEELQLAQTGQEPGKQSQRSVSEEGTAELESFKREMITFKQATERQLKEVKKFKASAEEKLDSLQTEMKELKVASEQAIEGLRWTVERQEEELVELREKLNQKDEQEEVAGKHPGLQLVEDLEDSTVHKRPLFKRLGGIFRSRKSKKKTKGKKDLYKQSDLPTKVAEETTTGKRGDVGRHDEFRGSQSSFEEEITTGRRDVGPHDQFRGSQKSFAEETTAGRRDAGRRDKFKGSQKSVGGRSMTGGYIRRAGSKSSRVSFEIAFPPRRRHSASSVVLRCYLEDEDFEDCKESREPIKIDKHPKSQKAKEGSKVEFKCKGQGNSTELSYQWFKDGVLLPNEDAPILVLDPVRLRDFGYYVCHVSYQDFYGKDSISSRAKLVVTPGSQSGMRLKRLADVDYNIIEEICVLLQTKESVLGGWREVAAAYGLERYKIDVLGNSKEPGKSVMEFATGTRPNLTVYDFCKVLKEKPIKRLDVVNILEDHFLV